VGFEISGVIGIGNEFSPVAVHDNCVSFYCCNFDFDGREVMIY